MFGDLPSGESPERTGESPRYPCKKMRCTPETGYSHKKVYNARRRSLIADVPETFDRPILLL